MLRDRRAVDGRPEAVAEALRAELGDGGEVRGHEAVDWQRLQLRDRRLREPELGDELARHARGRVALEKLQRRAAHDDGAMEQSFRGRHREQRRHFLRTAGLADDRDVAGVAAEAVDVVVYPSQRVHEIEHAECGRLLEVVTADLAEVGVTEHVEAMVRRDRDDVASQTEVRSVVDGCGTGAGVEAAAVTPHDHGPFAAVAQARRPHVQRETVLALGLPRGRALLVGLAARARLSLRCACAVVERIAHAGPRRRIHRRHETILAGRARAVRNTLEDLDAAILGAAHATERGLDFDTLRLSPGRVYDARGQGSRERALHDEVAA